MKVNIESRRDYELFVKKEVADMQVSNKQKAIIRKAIMVGFDDGVAYQANNGGYITAKDTA